MPWSDQPDLPRDRLLLRFQLGRAVAGKSTLAIEVWKHRRGAEHGYSVTAGDLFRSETISGDDLEHLLEIVGKLADGAPVDLPGDVTYHRAA